jgi:hypothetical protein
MMGYVYILGVRGQGDYVWGSWLKNKHNESLFLPAKTYVSPCPTNCSQSLILFDKGKKIYLGNK